MPAQPWRLAAPDPKVHRLPPAPKMTRDEYEKRVKLAFSPEDKSLLSSDASPEAVRGCTLEIVTQGMAAFGLPELELVGVSPMFLEAAVNILNTWAYYCLTKKPIWEDERVNLPSAGTAAGLFIRSPAHPERLRIVVGEVIIRGMPCQHCGEPIGEHSHDVEGGDEPETSA